MDSEQFSVNGVQSKEDYLKIALTAYENARMDGLCHEGAWECAVDAMRSLNVAALLSQLDKDAHYG